MAHGQINNALYDEYGDRWYTAHDDPVAILRAETRVKLPWIASRIPSGANVLDVGCGGGFLSNGLASRGFLVTGLDQSESSLATARRWDKTGSSCYIKGCAYELPFSNASFEAVFAMDMLEHVEKPERVIAECARVLKPGGKFFFSTISRNLFSRLVVLELLPRIVRNTSREMHIYRLLLNPSEVKLFCSTHGLTTEEITGLRPKFRSIPLRKLASGLVPEGLDFAFTKSLALVYLGYARKT